jgi:hypothetical protein
MCILSPPRIVPVRVNDCVSERGVLQLLVTANFVPTMPILVTRMMEAICSSETLVITRSTWCNVPENYNSSNIT